MTYKNLVVLNASELDAIAGGATSVKNILSNITNALNALGLHSAAAEFTTTLDTAALILPFLDAPLSFTGNT
ncbi:hypothetical protein [Glaciimonas immobilis]|uniref:Bacteriocin n=1 Tax=Glaciimonas immobilis TaxID=728004 RepID=A0A840S0N1_9BURK|nr:hypothetical protein [Glaciimonas immobilis]KAF3997232.1 hypothetical protein HAV38_16400 [Glaciimonas immobilis]MBB5202281.1 hypothetical protein [Glaciimonas immobilis]